MSSRTLTTCLLWFLVLLSISTAASQDTLSLTLDQAIDRALDHGYRAGTVTARYLSSRKNQEAALRSQWTSVALTAGLPDYRESLSQEFNPLTGRYEYYELTSTELQTALTITQPLVFTGGTLSFSQLLLGRNQTSGLSSATQSGRDYFSNLLVEYRQPILTPNTMALRQEQTALSLQETEDTYTAEQLDLVYSVTESFYSLHQVERRAAIAAEQVQQNEESYQTATGKFHAGLIPEVEVLQSEVDLATSQNDLLTAERELGRATNAFRLLTGVPTEQPVRVVADLAFIPVIIDTARAISAALSHRAEVNNAHRAIDRAAIDIDLASSKSHFRVDLVARYGVNGNDTVFDRVFRDLGRTRSASLTFSLPIFNWGSTAREVEAAEVMYRNSVEGESYVRQQVTQEILDLVSRVRVAESRIRVLDRSVAVAQKGYDISTERFRNGTITRDALAQAQQRLTQAKLNNLAALIDYNLGIADLTRKTFWDFAQDRPAGVPQPH